MYSKIQFFWRARGTNQKDTKDTKIDRSYISETDHTKNKIADLLGNYFDRETFYTIPTR